MRSFADSPAIISVRNCTGSKPELALRLREFPNPETVTLNGSTSGLATVSVTRKTAGAVWKFVGAWANAAEVAHRNRIAFEVWFFTERGIHIVTLSEADDFFKSVEQVYFLETLVQQFNDFNSSC